MTPRQRATFSFLALGALLACVAPAPTHAADGAPLLWKVSGEQATAYLLGSIHMGTKDMYPLTDQIEKAFASADALVLEIPMDAASMQASMAKMLSASMLPADTTLKDVVSDRVYTRWSDYCQNIGMAPASFDRFRPWAAGVTVTMLEAQRSGYSQQWGVDRYFVNQLGDRRMLGLETIDENLAIFTGLSSAESEQFLLSSLIDAKSTEKRLGDMIEAWQAGDAEALEAIIKQATREAPELKSLLKKLLEDRNRRMAERLASFMQNPGVYFVVVGAGHVVGDTALPVLMSERGYEVARQVPAEDATEQP